MTTPHKHQAPVRASKKATVAALGAITGFDAAAGAWLLAGYGNELACMGVTAVTALAVTTVLCLYFSERVTPDETHR